MKLNVLRNGTADQRLVSEIRLDTCDGLRIRVKRPNKRLCDRNAIRGQKRPFTTLWLLPEIQRSLDVGCAQEPPETATLMREGINVAPRLFSQGTTEEVDFLTGNRKWQQRQVNPS